MGLRRRHCPTSQGRKTLGLKMLFKFCGYIELNSKAKRLSAGITLHNIERVKLLLLIKIVTWIIIGLEFRNPMPFKE